MNKIIKAESAARANEAAAKKRADDIVEYAKRQAQQLTEDVLNQAQNEAKLIISEAQVTADGIVKQAQKLADMREKKVIAETEKKYDEAIKLILDKLQEK